MAEVKDQKKRHRSPAYPAVGLREAVDRADKFYRTDHKAGAPPEIAVKHMGFASAHGQAMAVLSALKKFGLIAESNGRVVPTQRAIEIIELPQGDPRRIQALKDAAISPIIYRELIEQHRETGWPADDVLKAELKTYKDFNPNAVDGFVKDLRDTLDFAGLSEPGALESEVEDEEEAKVTEPQPHQPPVKQSPPPPPGNPPNPSRTPVGSDIPVAADCIMGVNATGRVTQGGIEKLIAYLQLIKGSFPVNGAGQ